MRPKIHQLVEALTGTFGEHHAFLCRLHLERIDQLSAAIEELSARIEEEMRPFRRQCDRLATIPGVGRRTAEVIIAETGGDMACFRKSPITAAEQVTSCFRTSSARDLADRSCYGGHDQLLECGGPAPAAGMSPRASTPSWSAAHPPSTGPATRGIVTSSPPSGSRVSRPRASRATWQRVEHPSFAGRLWPSQAGRVR